jgi:hypothetical protein
MSSSLVGKWPIIRKKKSSGKSQGRVEYKDTTRGTLPVSDNDKALSAAKKTNRNFRNIAQSDGIKSRQFGAWFIIFY